MAKFLLKKAVMFVAVFLSCVMFVNFTTTDFFKANVLSVYATETDADDEGYDEFFDPYYDTSIEDDRYVDLLDEVFPENGTELTTESNGNVSFCTNLVNITGSDDEITCSFVAHDIAWSFTSYCLEVFTTSYLDENGGLAPKLTINGEDYYVSWYKEDKAFSDLLQGIVDGDTTLLDPTSATETTTLNLLDASTDKLTPVTIDTSASKKQTKSARGVSLVCLIIAAVIVTYVIVSETAEQIQAYKNEDANERQEETTGRYTGDEYIDDQHSVEGFKLGFSDFSGVGCEVISVYNLMIAIGQPKKLSEVIKDFEIWGIEYSVGWGSLGSSPRKIYRYFKRHGIKYEKYSNFTKFKSTVLLTESNHYIYSGWNNGNLLQGLHTFYINRVIETDETTGEVSSLVYIGKNAYLPEVDSFDDFLLNYNPFIVGYIVLE